MIISILISTAGAASVGKTIGHNEVHYCHFLLSLDAAAKQKHRRSRDSVRSSGGYIQPVKLATQALSVCPSARVRGSVRVPRIGAPAIE